MSPPLLSLSSSVSSPVFTSPHPQLGMSTQSSHLLPVLRRSCGEQQALSLALCAHHSYLGRVLPGIGWLHAPICGHTYLYNKHVSICVFCVVGHICNTFKMLLAKQGFPSLGNIDNEQYQYIFKQPYSLIFTVLLSWCLVSAIVFPIVAWNVTIGQYGILFPFFRW